MNRRQFLISSFAVAMGGPQVLAKICTTEPVVDINDFALNEWVFITVSGERIRRKPDNLLVTKPTGNTMLPGGKIVTETYDIRSDFVIHHTTSLTGKYEIWNGKVHLLSGKFISRIDVVSGDELRVFATIIGNEIKVG